MFFSSIYRITNFFNIPNLTKGISQGAWHFVTRGLLISFTKLNIIKGKAT